MSTKKIGRPLEDGKRKDVDLKVRIDDEMNFKLIKYSKEKNITKAEAVRLGIKLLLKNK